MRAEDFETRRALYASSGVLVESEHGPARILPPIEQVKAPIPLGAVSPCAVLLDLRLSIRALAAEIGPSSACSGCARKNGWPHCLDHELLVALERASRDVTDLGRAWDWAYALGYRFAPSKYVKESLEFAGQYARAVSEVV